MTLPQINPHNAPWAWFARGAPTSGLPTIAQNAPWIWAISADASGNPITSNYFFHVVDYGAIEGNNNTNKVKNTTAVLNAIADASVKGGIVFFGPGTWVTKNVDISGLIGVGFFGCGPLASIWKLADGENTDLVSGNVANINLTGTNGTGPSTGVNNCGFKDITLDGNYLNQSGTSWVLDWYGWGNFIQNVHIQNGLSGGIREDYYGPFPANHYLESKWSNFEVMDCQGEGIAKGGPTDCIWSNGVVANQFNGGSHNVHLYTNGSGLQATNIHLYRPSPFAYAVCLLVEGVAVWSNCEAEGSDCVNVVVLNDRFQWNGGIIFQGGRNCSGIQIGSNASLTLATAVVASPITLTTPIAKVNYAAFLQFVVTGSSASGSFALSGFDQNNNAASENVAASGDGTFTSVNAYSGTPTITYTGLTSASINVIGIGKAYPNTTSAHSSGGNTINFGPKNYTLHTHLRDHANYGIIFANDGNGNGNIVCNIFQTTGLAILGSPASNTTAIINTKGLTNDGTIATGGIVQFGGKASLFFQITDGSTVLVDMNTSAKILGLAQNTAIRLYSDSLNTVTCGLEGGTLRLAQSTTAAVIATSGSIVTASVGIARVAPTGNVTGIILNVGTFQGQTVTVLNESAFWLQMAASGTSHIASGISDYIAPNISAMYEWDSVTSLWYRVSPPYAVQPLALYDGELATGSAATATANEAYFVGVELKAPVVLTGIRIMFGVGGSGHYDVGIYSDTNGVPTTLLAHAASSSTALVTATGIRTPALIGGNITLFPGRYWLAYWVDNATDTIIRTAQAASIQINTQGSTTGPLPANYSSLSVIQNSGLKPIILGIIQNGFS